MVDMKFELSPYNRNITDEELISDLRKVAEANDGNVSERVYDANGRFNFGTIIKRFGTWNRAVIAAGLEPGVIQDISDEMLFENLEEVWIHLGRQPKSREIIAPLSRFHVATYERRFGGWRMALEKFVEVANSTYDDDQMEPEVVSPGETITATTKEYRHKTKRDVNWRMRFQVFARDKFKCISCGRSPAKDPEIELHADHIIPWSKGGETIIENLQTLCSVCNLGKSNIEI
jgi:hypothetical protein